MRYGFQFWLSFFVIIPLSANEEIVVTATRLKPPEVAATISENSPLNHAPHLAASAPPPIITAVNRVSESPANSGAAFSVITASLSENKLDRTLAETLSGQLGVTVVQNGGDGAATTLMIRGANSEQTSVMLDGLRLNNPVAAGGSGIFDLSSLTPLNLASVTILRGNNSTLYGSQAMGGAIDLSLKKGAGKISGAVATEFGASGKNLLYRERVTTQFGDDKFNFSLATHYAGSNGSRSAAIIDAQGNPANETDGAWRYGYNSRCGITPTEYCEFSLISLYEFTHARVDELDFGANTPVDARSPFNETQTLIARPKMRLHFFDEFLVNDCGFGYIEQKYFRGNAPTQTAEHYNARAFVGDWQTTLNLPQVSTTVVGAELRFETGETYGTTWGGDNFADLTKNSVRQFDVYAQEQLRFFTDDRWVSNFGGRLSHHELTGAHVTWHADTIFHLFETGTSFKASGGSGFKSPTLYQLYAPPLWAGGDALGKPHLKPEKSLGGDVGLVQSFFDGRNLSEATYFYTDFSELIAWEGEWWNGGYANINRAVTQGLELSNRTRVHEKVTLGVHYTFLDARAYDPRNKHNLLPRRPRQQFAFNANVKLCAEKVNLNSELIYYGECFDDAANRREVPSAWAWNLAGSYQVTKNLRGYGKLNNLLRQNYARAADYQSDGFGGFVGMELSF